MRFGGGRGGDDDVSVGGFSTATGLSAATRPAGNLGGGRGGDDDFSVGGFSTATGLSAATRPAGNLGGYGDDSSVMTGSKYPSFLFICSLDMLKLTLFLKFTLLATIKVTGMSAATRPAGNLGGYGGGYGDDSSVMTGSK